MIYEYIVMACAIIPRRPLTPILEFTRYAPTILTYHRAADFTMEPSLWYSCGPSLVKIRVDLYITQHEAIFLLLAL